jgi:serine/threonine protein kinase/Flp pilus assembly protein TadD
MASFPPTDPGLCSPLDELTERLAAELAAAWRRGERLSAEAFLNRHPELHDDREAAVRLVYEEVCLRQEHGEDVSRSEVLRRYPLFQTELTVLLDCDRLLQGRLSDLRFPEAGDSLGDFRLIAELGRGARGRVFLATQPSLADRPVVLKVIPRHGDEHLTLAHLQHTHIIPLYAAHDFPDSNLRALCMPYLGVASLEHLLRLVRDQHPTRLSGRDLLDALDRVQASASFTLPTASPMRRALAQLPYVEAVCLIASCLADALQHAHERGLVHLDLKPSNILLAADAQPLLLDFHLARPPLAVGDEPPVWVGGTPGYMSPEQQAAHSSAAQRGRLPVPVDGRSDIWSLGRVLYAALAGEANPADAPLTRLSSRNPQVSVGLADVIHRCLAQDPRDRYPDAASVAIDLRRHLSNLPLRGVSNRSPRERWRKWRRRRPYALLGVGLVLVLAATGICVTMVVVERFREARADLRDGQELLHRGSFDEAARTLERGRARGASLPLSQPLLQSLDKALRQARAGQSAQHLHALAERVRFLIGSDPLPSPEASAWDGRWREVWIEASALLGDGDDVQVRTDLADLAIYLAKLLDREQAVHLLDEAEARLGPCPALEWQRQRLRSDPGTWHLLWHGLPTVPPSMSEGLPNTFPEHAALGRSLLHTGDLDRAAAEFSRALDLCPQDFWANFHAGVCAQRRGRHNDAVYFFGVAVALAPRCPECYSNRGLAYADEGRAAEARRDNDRALELAPDLPMAALNRGVLNYQEGRYSEALDDLTRALSHGAPAAVVSYNRALIHLARKERAAALENVKESLRHDPSYPDALRLRDELQSRQRPE